MKSHNKSPAFRFLCSKQWNDLHKTGDSRKRYCSQCNKQVFLTENKAELALHAQHGRCIAILGRHDDHEANNPYDTIGSLEHHSYSMIGEPRAAYHCNPMKPKWRFLQHLFEKIRGLFLH